MNSWREQARKLSIDGRAFINGKRVAARTVFDCVSPRDGRVLCQVTRGDARDINDAVAAARQSFNRGVWSQMSPRARKDVLIAFAGLMRSNAQELALLESLDMGKPVAYSQKIDVGSAAHCIRWYGEAIDKCYDEIAPTPANSLAMITREPMGVIGAIVPWNYPMLMASWKIAPALAMGNSVVLKPSEKSPLSALRLAELAIEAGLPEGVLNVVPGFGDEAGSALALHPDVDCIGFTGSTRVGKMIIQYAGQSNLKRAYTELGGKSPFIIFEDADIERATESCVGSIFFNQGESCNAPSRLLVQRKHYDTVLARAAELAKDYQPADPLDDATVMGALVDKGQLDTVMRYIESGKKQGAALVCGGEAVTINGAGFFVQPTIFGGVHPEMTIACEEIFGPVLSVIPFDTPADAIALANDSSYGLAASVWTQNIDLAHQSARALRAGTIHVNCYDEDDITVPFGGYKQSGNGRDKSLHALEKYSELKTTWIKFQDMKKS